MMALRRALPLYDALAMMPNYNKLSVNNLVPDIELVAGKLHGEAFLAQVARLAV